MSSPADSKVRFALFFVDRQLALVTIRPLRSGWYRGVRKQPAPHPPPVRFQHSSALPRSAASRPPVPLLSLSLSLSRHWTHRHTHHAPRSPHSTGGCLRLCVLLTRGSDGWGMEKWSLLSCTSIYIYIHTSHHITSHHAIDRSDARTTGCSFLRPRSSHHQSQALSVC
jgi:hypothetical protein